MKKSYALVLLISLSFIGWTSESGSGVVSEDQQAIVRTSLEATEVLQSDLRTNLYGNTFLGGATAYSSFDSGGILDFRNVTSSSDVVKLVEGQSLTWYLTDGTQAKIESGATIDNVKVSTDIVSASVVSIGNVYISGSVGVGENSLDEATMEIRKDTVGTSANLQLSNRATATPGNTADLRFSPYSASYTGLIRAISETSGARTSLRFFTHNGTTFREKFVIGDGNTVTKNISLQDLQVGSEDSNTVYFVDDDVLQPATTQASADVFGIAQSISGTQGGLYIRGFSDVDRSGALLLEGNLGASDPTDSNPSVRINGYKSNGGTNVASLGNGETILTVENGGTAKIRVSGDGTTTMSGDLVVAKADDVGWSVKNVADTACTTTCGFGAVIGFDKGVNGASSTGVIVAPDATSCDVCVCAGPH